MGRYIPQYKPTDEHDFISLAEAHNVMDKHIVAQDTAQYGTQFCATCHMPISNGKIEIAHGRKRLDNRNFSMDVLNAKDTEYFERVFATYVHLGGVNMALLMLQRSWTPGCRAIALRPFMPPAVQFRGEYAPLALAVAIKEQKAEEDTRMFACYDPETALEYAKSVDKGPHPTTRAAACRSVETALAYASLVDKCVHISTLSKSLQDRRIAFDYLKRFPASEEVRTSVFNMYVANGEPQLINMWVDLCGKGDDRSKARMLAVGDKTDIVCYALLHHKLPDDQLRQAVLDQKSVANALSYAKTVDRAARADTRTAACMAPSTAVVYARDVDGGPCDETRAAASLSAGMALEYARTVDNGPHDVTRLGASTDPETAASYAAGVDKKIHEVTLAAVLRRSVTAYKYAMALGASDVTRTAACHVPEIACMYAKDVDGHPSDETRIASSYDAYSNRRYTEWEEELKEKQTNG